VRPGNSPCRVDATHGQIRDALRAVGAAVQSLAEVGNGCPDLLVCHRGRIVAIEVKTPAGKVSDLQTEWHLWWRAHGGAVAVVRSVEEALAAVGVMAR